MSIEIVLIPVAIAAVSAWQAKAAADEAGRRIVAVGTRMRDERLLQRALVDTGAAVTGDGDVITASWEQVQGRFTRDTMGVWSVHLVGDVTLEQGGQIVSAVDAAYGRHVQREVLARLRERAPAVGMELESETLEDDRSVTLVLNVGGNA